MADSILLTLARDSIVEVIEAKRIINTTKLLEEHPLLGEIIGVGVFIFVGEELHGSFETDNLPLIDGVILCAKKAAFEGEKVLSTSEYIACEVEVQLHTQEGVIKERDHALQFSLM